MICLSLSGDSMAAVLKKMAACPPAAAIIELRIDLIADLDLTALLRAKSRPVIITNRRREEGGGFTGTEEQRLDLLCRAAGSGADYLDLEAATDERLAQRLFTAVTAAGKSGIRPRVIISCHDFRATPGVRSLRQFWRTCREKGGDIVKVATFARHPADNLRIMSLIPYSRRRGQEIIAFAMGEQGRISRIMSLVLGAHLTYATAVRGRETAPGQLTCGELQKVLALLPPSREMTQEKRRPGQETLITAGRPQGGWK